MSSVFRLSRLSIAEVIPTQEESISAAPSTSQGRIRFSVFDARSQPESYQTTVPVSRLTP